MLKKILLNFLALIVLIYILHTTSYISFVFAAGEFAYSYDIKYDVSIDGQTEVTQKITIKNLTDRFYVSELTIFIGATDVREANAQDSVGALQTDISKEELRTKIVIKFRDQNAGLDKEYPWTLKFKSKDFTQRTGKVWQVSVPRFSDSENLENFKLTLSTPISFGDPTTIIPEPNKQSESGGKLHLSYTKEQLNNVGILANFGTNQVFDFDLIFNLKNEGILPAIAKIPFPANTAYQQVLIKDINPKPENVTIDEDGNYIGWFKVERRSNLEVRVNGSAKLFITRQENIIPLSTAEQISYTSSQKYWEKDNPSIRAKVDEILKDGENLTNKQKAKLIHKFVVDYLKYDHTRLDSEDFERLGALTALNNPDKALCGEFTDLFVALARAANIPARELTGYAFTENNQIRPLSLGGDLLHAWPEYFDPNLGWVMIDPTWENTTGGVDYFSKFDLNHFVLATRGYLSDEPVTADKVEVELSEADFNLQPGVDILVNSPIEVFAGFPAKLNVSIANNNFVVYPGTNFSVSAAKLDILGNKELQFSSIPPFGHLDYQFNLRSGSPFSSYEDLIQIKVGDQTITKKILIKPFFELKIFPYVIGGIIVIIILTYLSILGIHFYQSRKARNKT